MSSLAATLKRVCPACKALPGQPCVALRDSYRWGVYAGDRLKNTHPDRDMNPLTGYGLIHNQEEKVEL